MNETKENSREFELWVLWYIDVLLKSIKEEDKDMTLDEALFEYMVQYADDDYCQKAYKAIETIYNKGYIEGDIYVAYDDPSEPFDQFLDPEEELDAETLAQRVNYDGCSFKDVKVTPKGRKALETDDQILKLKELIKNTKADVIEVGKTVAPGVTSGIILELIKVFLH